MRMLLFVLVIGVFLSTNACAGARGRVKLDSVTQSTILDGDATGLVEACGNQPLVGFTYCRVQEGQAGDQNIWFIGPPAQCEQKEACVFIKVWNNQGQLVWGSSIPKGKTRVEVSWKTLLTRDTFEVGSRGFWSWTMQVYWKGQDGKERTSTAQGDIVLRVYRSGYIPLHEVASDPDYVWSWSEGNILYRMTSGLRAFVKEFP